jgi:lipopolysaccharide export system permease protein
MMRFSYALSRYVFKHYLLYILIVIATFSAIILLLDGLEIVRRMQGKPVGLSLALLLAALKLPSVAIKTLPFAALVGSILAYQRLSHHAELVAMRACGVSAWQFVLPAAGAAAALGMLAVAVLNPVSAGLLSYRQKIEAKRLDGGANVLSVLSSGLWLRQRFEEGGGKALIRAKRISPEETVLHDAVFFVFDKKDEFLRRIDAEEAKLEDGEWALARVSITEPGKATRREASVRLPSSISIRHIRESFLPPESIPVWKLPGFVQILQDSGFPARRHLLHFHAMLALPAFLAAMAMFGAAFAVAPVRSGKTGFYVSLGVLFGFVLYFVNDLAYALGLSGKLPVAAAAWIAPVVSLLSGTAALLHREEG